MLEVPGLQHHLTSLVLLDLEVAEEELHRAAEELRARMQIDLEYYTYLKVLSFPLLLEVIHHQMVFLQVKLLQTYLSFHIRRK